MGLVRQRLAAPSTAVTLLVTVTIRVSHAKAKVCSTATRVKKFTADRVKKSAGLWLTTPFHVLAAEAACFSAATTLTTMYSNTRARGWRLRDFKMLVIMKWLWESLHMLFE